MAGIGRGRLIFAVLALAAATDATGFSQSALAQGATDYPIPSTAAEAFSPIAEGFESPIEPREDLKGARSYVDWREQRAAARRAQSTAAPFFRDTDIRANSRTYWFDEDSFGLDEPQALTSGGYLSYQSGYLADFFQLRSVLYTSQPLYAGEDAGQTMNLTPAGDAITTLGQISGRMKITHQELTVGRQLVRTPYINPYDVRMIPLTYEGVVLLPEHRPDHPFRYVASYLWRYKPHDQARFIPLSRGLDVDQDEGVLITGANYHGRRWNYGVTNYWINEVLNTAYAEIDHILVDGGDDGLALRIGINDLDQRALGTALSGAPYQTYQASARVVGSYRGFVLTGAVGQVGDEAGIEKPFGYSTAYVAMIVSSFDRPGEQSFLVTLSYDFARLGLEGVTFQVGWGQGFDAVDPLTRQPLPDESELDLRLVYEPHRGPLQGLRVELEYIDWDLPQPEPASDDLTQFRAIVNYVIPLR